MIEERATALLRRFYGYKQFRPMQLDVIRCAAESRDCVVLMPTGGGKSICYQIPALLADGCALVVSPLIALMVDQVAALQANGIPAASVNSTQSDTANREIMEAAYAGRIKLLYISPERLLSELDRIGPNLPVNLIAIDEAHCISQWGHDFRPEYTQLAILKRRFPDVPVMALTATADRLTREDIARQLALRDPRIFISSFDRPNLSLKVMTNPGKTKRIQYICSLINKYRHDSGIVYCLSRKSAEATDAELRARGYKSACYHAGLSVAARNSAQTQFINGDIQIICATVAFGMGIDKSNIRWVVHNNLPGNIESYYQEIGRAGRDGLDAETVLFYSFADIAARQSFVDSSGQQAINTEKLARMKEFAESQICRRRVLLSYFNETLDHDCGNCDVCLDPPERIDGTIIAQMALSAIVRTNQQVGQPMLIDILRGSGRAELRANGFDRIKTYGVGRDLSFAEWNSYLLQLLQLGIIDIAYNEANHLKITPYGLEVLRGNVAVKLARFYFDNPTRKTKRKAPTASAPSQLSEQLLAHLKQTRTALARREGVPPYIIFTDKTLSEMARVMPTDLTTFSTIEGVGEKKIARYANTFIAAIQSFLSRQ